MEETGAVRYHWLPLDPEPTAEQLSRSTTSKLYKEYKLLLAAMEKVVSAQQTKVFSEKLSAALLSWKHLKAPVSGYLGPNTSRLLLNLKAKVSKAIREYTIANHTAAWRPVVLALEAAKEAATAPGDETGATKKGDKRGPKKEEATDSATALLLQQLKGLLLAIGEKMDRLDPLHDEGVYRAARRLLTLDDVEEDGEAQADVRVLLASLRSMDTNPASQDNSALDKITAASQRLRAKAGKRKLGAADSDDEDDEKSLVQVVKAQDAYVKLTGGTSAGSIEVTAASTVLTAATTAMAGTLKEAGARVRSFTEWLQRTGVDQGMRVKLDNYSQASIYFTLHQARHPGEEASRGFSSRLRDFMANSGARERRLPRVSTAPTCRRRRSSWS
jgi:hypothetical protein